MLPLVARKRDLLLNARETKAGRPSRSQELSLPLSVFAAGTPARLAGDSIQWSALEPQPAQLPPRPFSSAHSPQQMLRRFRAIPFRVLCFKAQTNPTTHRLVHEHLGALPVHRRREGVGVGPRYCPSIANKVRADQGPFRGSGINPREAPSSPSKGGSFCMGTNMTFAESFPAGPEFSRSRDASRVARARGWQLRSHLRRRPFGGVSRLRAARVASLNRSSATCATAETGVRRGVPRGVGEGNRRRVAGEARPGPFSEWPDCGHDGCVFFRDWEAN